MATATQSLREIVTAKPSAVAILERFEIDLCSQADAQLERVCAELQLSVDQVLEKLADAESLAGGTLAADVESYSLTRLIQHIVRTHHQTVRQDLPRYVELSQRIADKHGDQAPEFRAAAPLIRQLRDEMFAHLEKEEQILFPHIVRLEESTEHHAAASACCFASVTQPIAMMMREHHAAEGILAEVRGLLHGFTAPDWACARNAAFHAGLAAFEKDLQQHVHLENDLLFPRAAALETQLKARR
ncbi:MAG TPA: DUF542 domain-containing protein [Terracidiphilus sp.]|jgi:regulator of cell morphogenesis and NO signaling